MDKSGPIELDIVTHDIRKYFSLLLNRNGYVLEQIYSPLVVHQTPMFDELRAIARGSITKHHRHHYQAFANNQWRLVQKSSTPTVKGLLYTYRVLLAGIHLMRTGEVEANLRVLNETARLAPIDDLIARKLGGSEKQAVRPSELSLHEAEQSRLHQQLEASSEASHLPEHPTCRDALDDLLVRVRKQCWS
jgi:predicted nucleotidyltransferase